MKAKKPSFVKAAELAALEHQLKKLGFKSQSDYKEWCLHNGFSTKLNKSNEQYASEHLFAWKQQEVTKSFADAKKPNVKRLLKNFLSSLEAYVTTDVPKEYSRLYEIKNVFNKSDEAKQKQIKKFLNTLINHANLLEDVFENRKFIHLLSDIITLSDNWVRDIGNWKCRSHNTYKQFTSLLRHAFVKYEMPSFMDKAWISNSLQDFDQERKINGDTISPHTMAKVQKSRVWYLHLGKGLNPRTLPDLPIPFTKRMAHFFMKAPDNYKVNEAIRYGQILSLNGVPRLADALRESRIGDTFSNQENENFWESVIRWFIAQPMFDYAQHVGPVIDYVNNQRFTPRQVIENGAVTAMGPPQPGFNMKGRDPETMLRLVEAWHTQLGKEKKIGNLHWEHQTSISDFEFAEGIDGTSSRKIWSIKELCSSGMLQEEGRKMRHCVSSYSHSCHTGRCSIWAMDKLDNTGKEKQLTIEVVNASRTITQVRGKFNAKATEQQMKVIQRWATMNKLGFGSWL